MRIERLPQENLRTQGSARREWYRRHNPTHVASCATLLDGALATRGNYPYLHAAVLLGAGACTELPLERLTRACTPVVLVDVDTPAMTAARNELPAKLRERVTVVTADITGGVSVHLAAELQAQPWADLARFGGPGSHAALDAAASCLEHCPIADPPVLASLERGRYGLVVSSLVLTQLFSLPLLDVYDALHLQAPAVAEVRDAYPRYRAAAQTFRRRLALAHLSLFRELLAPGGAGLLITDVTGHLLPARAGAHADAAHESLAVLPPAVLTVPDDVAARFALVQQPRRWRWLVTEPTGALPGRAYDVVGALFRRA
jgi:hypothetical protein